MQKTIESFFKQSSTPSSMPQTSNFNDLFDGIRAQNHPEIRIKYTRQPTRVGESTSDGLIEEEKNAKSEKSKGKILNKKRKYAQFHLELGQSDFLLHTCKICGMKYSKGDEIDEKVHSTFHKNYTHGIPFKVEEVVKMMEIELGDGWIFHELCQVYLFISSQRVAACMIVEPINTAHKLLSDSLPKIADGASGKKVIPKPKTLQFGEVCFQREVSRKGSNHRNSDAMDSNLLGSIVCEEEATPASCGIRAIWVSPSNRRKGIATHLLDAVRKSFCTNYVLERSQLAFSNPTSAGKALATNYTGTGSILVYKT
ncbi:hypothetical protein SOVF_132500 [Spinacia oleracea]|nr:hypothetical protein SOVF_132500 [Spinacia oleracea]